MNQSLSDDNVCKLFLVRSLGKPYVTPFNAIGLVNKDYDEVCLCSHLKEEHGEPNAPDMYCSRHEENQCKKYT